MKEGNNSTNEWEEEQHLALFIDILGISDRINKAKEIRRKLNEIGEDVKMFYDSIHDYLQRQIVEDVEAKVKTFSDSAYISIPIKLTSSEMDNPYFRIRMILNSIGKAQAELILNENRKRIFLRGGVGLGYRVFYGEDVEVSKAYYESYRMEQEAIYPIIKLSKEMTTQLGYFEGYKEFRLGGGGPMPHENLVMETSDAAGNNIYFLNYLGCYVEKKDIKSVLSDHKQAILDAYKQGVEGAANNIAEKKIALKYAFLAYKYHNVFATKAKVGEGFMINKEIPSYYLLHKEVEELGIKEKSGSVQMNKNS